MLISFNYDLNNVSCFNPTPPTQTNPSIVSEVIGKSPRCEICIGVEWRFLCSHSLLTRPLSCEITYTETDTEPILILITMWTSMGSFFFPLLFAFYLDSLYSPYAFSKSLRGERKKKERRINAFSSHSYDNRWPNELSYKCLGHFKRQH